MPVSRKRKKRSASSSPTSEATPIDLPDRRAMEAFLSQLTGRRGESALDTAQDLMYDAWDSSSRKQRIALATKALSLSPLCADAYVLLAQEPAGTAAETLELYRRGNEAGELAIGEAAFIEDVGHFWGLLETRPYMRARLGLAMVLRASGAHEEAVGHFVDMLRLNPGDNQGIRYILLIAFLEAGRDADAEALLERYKDDGAAGWAWGSVLLSYRREGGGPTTQHLLMAAMEANRHVGDYLLDRKKIPARLPDYITLGGEDEAIEYVREGLAAWADTSGALAWLKTASPAAPHRRRPAPRPR